MIAYALAALLAFTSVTALAQDTQQAEPVKKAETVKVEKAPTEKAEQKMEQKGDALHPRVKIETTLGDIVVKLDGEKAPITVENFVHYANDGYFKDTIFHRVIAGFMIQGGGFTTDMVEKKEGLRDGILNEWKTGLKNKRGAIAMARKGWSPRMPQQLKEKMVNSATSQFFINVVDNARLDQPQQDDAAYCAFGEVVEGMDVVDAIRNTEVVKHPKYPAPQPVTPKEPVIIKAVTLLDGVTYDQVKEATKAGCEAHQKTHDDAIAAAKAELEAVANRFKNILEKGEDENGNKLEKTETGLMYVVLKEGEGDSPGFIDPAMAGKSVSEWLTENEATARLPQMNKVEVHYTGWLMNGTKFDSSRDRGQPTAFPLHQVVKGWSEGLSMMKVGGRRLFIIPADLAYGKGGRGPIPPNSTLVFDVELLGIQ